MPQPNLGQPQYGDRKQIKNFMSHLQQGTYGPVVERQGPGRPSTGAPSRPRQAQRQVPPALPQQIRALQIREAEAKSDLEFWAQRMKMPGAGPKTQEMYARAAEVFRAAARAVRQGTGFYEGV